MVIPEIFLFSLLVISGYTWAFGNFICQYNDEIKLLKNDDMSCVNLDISD